jgi:hypothetical protein
MALWVLVQAVAVPFRALAAESKQGRWQGSRFIYDEPQRLVTVVTVERSPSDNDTTYPFRVPNVPPGALLDYKIEIDGPNSRMNCIIFGAYFFRPLEEIMKTARWDPRGRVTLRKDRMLGLRSYSQPNTLAGIVRVSLLAWEIDPSILMDYTDLNKHLRFAVGPPDTSSAESKTSHAAQSS